MPKKYRLAAVIDIGSNELKLQIAQMTKAESETGVIKYLENVSYPLGLGRDTFHTGRMSFEKADKACEIIKKFLQLTQEYGVKDIKTVATTAVREAANKDYILDQIKIKTGLSVDVMDDLDEKRYIHKLLTHYAGDSLKQSALMVYISTGSIGVSALEDGKMPLFNNIRVGSLRMGELFGDLAAYTHDFYILMEEYLSSFTDLLKPRLSRDIKNFVVAGQEMELIAGLLGIKDSNRPLFEIPRKKFLDVYNNVKQKTADQIAVYYGIDNEKADILLPAFCIYQNLLSFTSADSITASRLLPCDAIIYEMLYPKVFAAIDRQFYKNTLLAARMTALRFNADEDHFNCVNLFAVTIYDKMKKIHGLGTPDKLLLQSAAILHEVGKFISGDGGHSFYSYEAVRGSYLPGLNKHESEIVALICLYHSRFTPTIQDSRFSTLDIGDRVRVSKLAAILRLADALDRSCKQKFKRISVKITEDTMAVTAESNANTALEQWAFNEKGRFFGEVFGIKAELKVRMG
jgi:exopolyphosphatase/guanosine-5'-triphosphate,3'-diphosphate pyrophosphatase